MGVQTLSTCYPPAWAVCWGAWAGANPGSAELSGQICSLFCGSRKHSSPGFTGKTIIADLRRKKSAQKTAVPTVPATACSYRFRVLRSHHRVRDFGGGWGLSTSSTHPLLSPYKHGAGIGGCDVVSCRDKVKTRINLWSLFYGKKKSVQWQGWLT